MIDEDLKTPDTEKTEAEAEPVTARDATADTMPVPASDPRSITIDRSSTAPSSPGASADEAAAAERAD